MKQLSRIFFLSLLPILLISCKTPADRLQANTWVLYEHININPVKQEEIKDKFTRAEEKLVLDFEGDMVSWLEDGRPQSGQYQFVDESHIIMLGNEFRVNRLGDYILILEREQDGSLDQYLFAPENCSCWVE